MHLQALDIDQRCACFPRCLLNFLRHMILFFPLVWIETGRFLIATPHACQFWSFLPAPALDFRAAWSIGTTSRRVEQVGWLTGYRVESNSALVIQPWNGVQQTDSIGVSRFLEKLFDRGGFYHVSGVHHIDVFTGACHYP